MASAAKLIGYLALVAIFNWPYAFTESSELVLGNVSLANPMGLPHSEPVSTSFAGWPAKAYLHQEYPELPPLTRFSLLAAIANGLFWLSIPGLLFLYHRHLDRSAATPDAATPDASTPDASTQPRVRKRQLRLADILVATAVIALMLGYWQVIRSRASSDRKLAEEIFSRGGGVKLASMLPWPVAKLFQASGHTHFLRIRTANLQRPDDALLSAVVASPYLQALSIAGDGYDLSSLAPIQRSLILSDLAVVGRELDAESVAILGSLQALQSLNLMRTNLTASGMLSLNDLPRLRNLNLVHTDVSLAEISRVPSFASTLRKLSLPHPASGEGDALLLQGWPELTELACYEYDEALNKTPVMLRLQSLPKLSRIELDALQKFDLDLEDLPRLSAVTHCDFQWKARTAHAQIVPSYPWIRKLRIVDVPMLTELSVFAAGAESVEIDQATDMKLHLSVFDQGSTRATTESIPSSDRESADRPAYLTQREIPQSIRQKWITDLGRSSGPTELDLQLVPLENVDLTPLFANASLRRLSLGMTGVSPNQLLGLAGMTNLQELSLAGLAIDGKLIESLAKKLPALRILQCERHEVNRLRLEYLSRLENIFIKPSKPADTDPMPNRLESVPLDALRLVGLPVLAESLEIIVPLQYLYIEDAPALTGLSFSMDLPAAGVVKGLRDLKFFAAGGANCSDAIVSEICKCQGLRKLTLAHAGAAAETLQQIGQLRKLEYLVLTGSQATDKLLGSLEASQLKVLRLDQTRVTDRSVNKICQLHALQELDLGDIPLSAADVVKIAKSLPNLRKLGLRGAELSADAVRQISEIKQLRSLDLSACEVDDEMLGELLTETSLTQLKLNVATLGQIGFSKLVNTLDDLRFELSGTHVDAATIGELFRQDRVIDRDSPAFAFPQDPSDWDAITPDALDNEGEIDPDRFAPKTTDII